MTKIEQVARAIAEANMEDYEELKELHDALARAAIVAMRNPTREMIGAANRNNHPRDIDTWHTMIDVALGVSQ